MSRRKFTDEESKINFSDASLKRLSLAGGNEMFSKDAYTVTRIIIRAFLMDILETALELMEYRRKKTLTVEDIKKALNMYGISSYN